MSFVYLGIGFFFYHYKFPEKCIKKAKKEKMVNKAERKCVELFCPSHFWWHMFVVLNGYTLYWLSFRVNLHVEYYYDKNEMNVPMMYEEPFNSNCMIMKSVSSNNYNNGKLGGLYSGQYANI